jgi:hypothetical protein
MPKLRLIERRRLPMFLYAIGGGFSRRQLMPTVAYRALALLERCISPLPCSLPSAAW